MKNIVVLVGPIKGEWAARNPSIQKIEIDEIPVFCGILPTEGPHFDGTLPENRNSVLIKVKAFSCNFFDKALIYATARKGIVRSYYIIGSEFVAEVVEKGMEVTNLEVGDRVIGNNHYTGATILTNGIITNHASREFQILPSDKLMKVPPHMPDVSAAAFGIGAQTSYSIIRKLNLKEGANVLVTAAKANISLFCIRALQKYNVNVYAVSSSTRFAEELSEMGVKELVQVNLEDKSFAQNKQLREIVAANGLFDYVIDPFFDCYLGKVVELMAPSGTYVTCGFHNQHSSAIDPNKSGQQLQNIMITVFVKNLQIVGNCTGLTQDLENALADHTEGCFDVIVDSVFDGNQVGDFLNRTYNHPDRFGKVVYQYQ